MKRITKILTMCLLVLAVLFLGACATDTAKESDKADTKQEAEENTYITDLNGIIALKYSNGTSEMSFVQGDSYWYYEADESLVLNQDSVLAMLATFQKMEAVKTIEKPETAGSYGLETPKYTIEIKDLEGKEVILYVGDATENGYYVKAEGEEKIYVMSDTVVSSMVFDVTTLVDENEEILDMPTEDIVDESASEDYEEPITEE